MRLYSEAGAPNALRVLMLLREKAFDIEIVELDLEAGAHKAPEFLAINPVVCQKSAKLKCQRLPLLRAAWDERPQLK